MPAKYILILLPLFLLGAGCRSADNGLTESDVNKQIARDEIVEYQGVLARELTQISGIKIWEIGDNNEPLKGSNDWIWVVPSPGNDPTGERNWDGDWSFFMLQKYAGMTKEQYDVLDFDETVITVTGKLLEKDCGVAIDDGTGKCIVTIQADKIELQSLLNSDKSTHNLVDCQDYKTALTDKIRQYNLSQNRQLRDSNNSGEGAPIWNTYIEYNELKDLFYSPKTDSCLYLESRETMMRNGVDIDSGEGDWKVVYDTYYLLDAKTNIELNFVDDHPFLQVISRGDIFNNQEEIDKIIIEYK